MRAVRLFCIVFLFLAIYAGSEGIGYVVAEKDTLWSISQRYKISVEALKKVNNITDEKTLRVGMTLIIPTVYTVEKGDNLWKIAREHQTSVQVIRELNNISNDEIHVGDLLVLPEMTEANASGDETKSADVVETAKVPEVKNSATTGDSLYWPVKGIRTAKKGKISGMEILGSQGDDVISITGGEVVWNATSPVFGNVIIVESPSHYLYLYSGLAETIVEFGEKVNAGKKIAELGVNPHTGEAKLLFSVYKDGKLIDPAVAPRG